MKYLALLATLALSLGTVACKKTAAAAAALPITVAIFPTATQSVLPGGTVTFTSTVANNANTAVNWEVNNNVGGDATTGTISTAGVYTAPSASAVINPFDVTVTAQSAADTSVTASTTVAIVQPPPVAVAPTAATLVAGQSQQFTPTTIPANSPVTWEVNSVVGGNSGVGSITQAGLYTAPEVPPQAGTVLIEAVLQSDVQEIATATVTVTYSNASLQAPTPSRCAGAIPAGCCCAPGFTADGNGHITAGIEDINNGINLVQAGVSFTGTFTVGGDGRGTVTLSDGFNGNTAGAGNSKFSVVIVSAQQAQMEEVDTFASASGEADLQNTASFNSASFHGEFTFDFSGADAAGKAISAVGQFLADGVGGGANQPAQEDVNDNGTLTSNMPTFSFQSVGANGRGLATLNGTNYSFYMVSAAQAKFISIGNPAGAVTSGAATLQTSATFSAASLGGNSLLITSGSGGAGSVATAISFFAQSNGNPLTGTWGLGNAGVLTQNSSGSVTNVNTGGTYTVAVNGRGTASLSFTIPNSATVVPLTYVFYMVGVNQAVIQETDSSSVSDGSLLALSGGPFSTSALNNGYAVQLTGIGVGRGEQDAVGQITLANGQVATGTVDINTANGAGALTAFAATPGVAIPAGTTYSISNNQGPFNVTLGATSLTFQAYFLSSSSLFLLRTDTTDNRVLRGNLYQDVSLSPAIVSANSAAFGVNLPGTFTVIATGNPAPTLTETGALPSGVTFNSQTGVLSGTPATGTGGTTTQSYPITFTATNNVGSTAVQNFTLTVAQCLILNSNGGGTCVSN